MQNLQIRYSQMADGKILAEWLKDHDNWPYFPIASEKEAQLFADNWIGFSRFRVSLTAILEDQVVGIATLFLMPYKKVSHSPFFYMIVDKHKRNKGIGSDLLKNIMNLAENYVSLEALVAEVYTGSPFIALLEKNHFQQFAFQENYIKIEKNKYLARILFQHFFTKK